MGGCTGGSPCAIQRRDDSLPSPRPGLSGIGYGRERRKRPSLKSSPKLNNKRSYPSHTNEYLVRAEQGVTGINSTKQREPQRTSPRTAWGKEVWQDQAPGPGVAGGVIKPQWNPDPTLTYILHPSLVEYCGPPFNQKHTPPRSLE